MYYELKQFNKAKTLQQKYVDLLQLLVGPHDLKTITAIASSEDFQARTKIFSIFGLVRRRARRLRSTKAAFEGIQYMNGDISETAINYMVQLAWSYWGCGSLYKAKLLLEELADLMIQKHGEDSPLTTSVLANLKEIRRSIAWREVIYWWLPKSLLEKEWVRT